MQEIERKFLVINDSYHQNTKGELFKQGYLSTDIERVVRVRVSQDKGFITIKSKTISITRKEYEYEIPLSHATELLTICISPIIEKLRYKVEYQGFTWEVDKFLGENEGLVLAEIELESEDTQFIKPNWIGNEVTKDYKYSNSNLIEKPFRMW